VNDKHLMNRLTSSEKALDSTEYRPNMNSENRGRKPGFFANAQGLRNSVEMSEYFN
jgi:hypothetical protein